MRCSFCLKSQTAARKLIASPAHRADVYICIECVQVCAAIIEDERGGPDPRWAADATHPFLTHPLASELMDAIVTWISKENDSQPVTEELAEVRRIAARMLRP